MNITKPAVMSPTELEKRPQTAAGCFAYSDGGLLDADFPGRTAAQELLAAAKGDGFKGERGECHALTLHQRKFIIAGLGRKKDFSSETLRRAAGGLYQYSKKRASALAVAVPSRHAATVVEGLALSSYRFQEYRKDDAPQLAEAFLLAPKPAERSRLNASVNQANLRAEAVAVARDLVNRAPSDKTPQSLADLARGFSGPQISVSVINSKQAAELGMGAFLGVARGSAAEPAFIHLAYKPKGAKKKIALVGKGITFDSGGISLKPPASMESMKMDMAGAAAILGLFPALPKLKVRAEVHGFCAVTYNMPGPDALKPGDVVKAMNGKTIEVLNTDAEGRLVLADALVYAARLKPDAIIDLATLTGAVTTALGSQVSAAMTNHKALLSSLLKAGAACDEAVCELPLVADYRENIKSPIADLQNIGKKRGEAGTIIGGLFLEEFVDSLPWVHYDIAGTAWTEGDGPYVPRGGTGVMVRTLLTYLASL